MKGISVIVCCYNSVNRLKPTIEHLLNQVGIASDLWEVLIIDNASTDKTAEVASSLWENGKKENSPNFRIIKELTPGKSAALLCGIENSLFDFVLICDDDNWLSDNYLYEAQLLIKENINVGIIGAYGSPIFENKEPPFFWKNQYHALAVGPQYLEEGDITNTRKVIYSAGMILNKNAFLELRNKFQFKFQTTGRIGASLASSEDHEICLALRIIGYKILWTKKLKFSHYIPKNRTEISYYKKLFLGFGLSDPMLIGYHLDRTKPKTLKNDYRYIALRNIRYIASTYIKIMCQGYLLKKSEYQILDLYQQLYSNIGCFKTTIRVKNNIRDSFIKSSLFVLDSK